MNESLRRSGWKYIAVVLVAGLLVSLAGVWFVRAQLANQLTVVNESGQAIEWITIRVGRWPVRLEDIPPGESISARFDIKSDDSFAVEGQLADGTLIGGGFGYVTHGMYGERASFVVQRDGEILFDQN